MHLNHRNDHESNRRTFHITAVTLLLIFIALLAGCGGNGQQTNSNGGQSNTSPTPCPSPIEKKGIGDTPIVVTGGSLHLELPLGMKKDSEGKYSCSDCVLSNGAVYDDNEASSDTHLDMKISSDKECTITIDFKGNKTLQIFGDPVARTVTVTFEEGGGKDFVPRGKYRFFHRSKKIEEITIANKGGDTTTFKKMGGTHPLPDKGKAYVEINLMEKK